MRDEIKTLLDKNCTKGDEASQKPGMIYQIWEDGEVTLQKCGELLWRRNLHMIEFGLKNVNIGELLPHSSGEHKFAFLADGEVVNKIRDLIEEEEKDIWTVK